MTTTANSREPMTIGTRVIGPISDAVWTVKRCVGIGRDQNGAKYLLILERDDRTMNDGHTRMTGSGWYAIMPLFNVAADTVS